MLLCVLECAHVWVLPVALPLLYAGDHMEMVPPSAGCDYASVEQVNRDTVNPLLRQLVQTPFMRYFKVTCRC